MDARVRDVMTPGPIGVDYYQSIREAARTMRDWGAQHGRRDHRRRHHGTDFASR